MSVFFLISFVFLCNNLFGDTTYSVNSSLVADERLSSSGTAATFSATVTLDGAKYIWTLPPVSTTPVITVQNGFTATLTNILLQYLLPSHISLGAGSNIVFGDGSIIYLGDSDSLNYTWGFSGTSALDGRAKTLTLGSNGVIEAQSGATLTLKDLTIYDVNATNLRCADNTASIIFDNVKIVNRNVWNFATGAFEVTNNLTFAGGGKFVYQSAYASTINDNSTLFLTDGMTFSYDPAKGVNQAVAGQQNLVFTTSSSKLWCDGVTLKITNTGMRLTKGTLQFDRKNSIYSDANLTDTSHGLMLGDGIFWNDPQIILGPDSRLSLESGVLEYDLIEDGYLKYGDGTAFKHSSYGFYLSNSALGAGGAYGNNALGDFDLSNGSRLYVLPGTSSTRFGTGFIGTRVLSGDTIKLESFTDSKTQSSVQGGNVFLTNTGSQVTGAFTLQSQATLSSPTPPYAQARFNFFADAMRIYKKGASVGSPIAIGDQVYFQYGYYSYAVWYFGSSNLTYSTNYKEVFWYQMSDFSPTTPPNFVSNYLWNIDTIIKKAYLNAGPDFNLSVTNPSAAWAANPPSAYQF